MSDSVSFGPPKGPLPPAQIPGPDKADYVAGVLRFGFPDLVTAIATNRAVLEALAGVVVERLELLGLLTTRFCDVFAEVVDADDPQADPIRTQVEERLEIAVLWRLADQLRDAHPDVSSGMVPSGQAHERVNRRFGIADNSTIVDRLAERGD